MLLAYSPFLAEDFSGCYPASLAFHGFFALLALISLYPSNRGHWSGPAIAWPAFLVGFLGTAMFFIGMAQVPADQKIDLGPVPWLIYPSPILTGLASIVLYSIRKPSSF